MTGLSAKVKGQGQSLKPFECYDWYYAGKSFHTMNKMNKTECLRVCVLCRCTHKDTK